MYNSQNSGKSGFIKIYQHTKFGFSKSLMINIFIYTRHTKGKKIFSERALKYLHVGRNFYI